MYNLPDDSRLIKHFSNSRFNQTEHLLADIRDLGALIAYYTSISAARAAEKGWPKLAKKSPKPVDRPRVYEEKKIKKFTPVKDAMKMFNNDQFVKEIKQQKQAELEVKRLTGGD